MLDIKEFSKEYMVKEIMPTDIAQVYSLCRKNELYYEYCPPLVTEQSIRDDRKALPKGKSIEDKYYVGFYNGNQLIAVLDLIDGYPDKNTAFIGFFMTDVSIQHQGIGTKIIQELIQYLKNRFYGQVRLGWVKGNPQSEAFWHKNGFFETGVSYQTGGYTVIVAQRDL